MLNILESLPLINPNAQQPPVPKRASTVQPIGRKASNTEFQINGNQASSGSMPPPSSRVKSTPDFSEFKAWAQDAISTQKMDIDRVSGTLIHIEEEMQTFRSFMKEVRTELATGRESHQKLIQDQDGLAKVSGKLGQLQTQVTSMDQEFRGKSGESLSRDIEIIISDMLQVSKKANEVDDLKMEVHQLNSQVKGIEDVVQVTQVPSEVENLRIELQILKSRLESIEGVVNQAPPPKPTRQPASSEESLSQSTQGRPQIAKRFPRVEIHVKPPEQPSNPITNPKSRAPTSEDLEDGPHNPYLKRKYGDIEKSSAPADQEAEEPSLPTKRRRVSRKSVLQKFSQNVEHASGSSRVHFKSPGPEVIEILSSERGSSPRLGEATESGGINSARENPRVNKQQPLKATLNDASNSDAKAPQGKSRKGSVRRTASMNSLVTPSTVAVQDAIGSESVPFNLHSRDSQGALITTSGKVDRRSLRYKTSHSNKENKIPVQGDQDMNRGVVQQDVSENQASERIHKAHSASAGLKRTRSTPNLRPSGVTKDLASGEPSADAPLPSIERDELDRIQAEKASEAQTVEQTSSKSAAAKPTKEKPYRCESCGNGYTTASWLKQVSALLYVGNLTNIPIA